MTATKPANALALFMNATLIVSALGYFVDAYDILLFSIVRVASLKDLGLSGEALTKSGLFLMNMQMSGMIAGSIFWGILGDKRGRLAVLFGSILLYSIANIANAFVHSVNAYAVWRFIAGLGLAGELGAGVTLVMEQLPKSKRGLGTTLIGAVGLLGIVVAALVGDKVHWRTAYLIGGGMGLVLLVLRASVKESLLFQKVQQEIDIRRGSFLAFFTNWRRFRLYIACIIIGVPIYFMIAILLTLAPELSQAMGVTEPVSSAKAILFYYIAITFGDVAAGLLSQKLQSRKKVILFYLASLSLSVAAFYAMAPMRPEFLYLWYSVMGFFAGFFILIPTIAAETFGTNLRATAASTVPNFIRGSTVLLNLGLVQLKFLGLVTATQVLAGLVMAAALLAAFSLRETFHDDLDFNESI